MRRVPEGEASIYTTPCGTWGYIAPELGGCPLTTKADVYSFGVVLMELITARKALDNTRSEDNRHLAKWFCNNHLDKEWAILVQAIDPTIQLDEEIVASIQTVAELAGCYCSYKPSKRPEMVDVVSALSKLLKEWKPLDELSQESSFRSASTSGRHGIDIGLTLQEEWQKLKAHEGASQICSSSSYYLSANHETN